METANTEPAPAESTSEAEADKISDTAPTAESNVTEADITAPDVNIVAQPDNVTENPPKGNVIIIVNQLHLPWLIVIPL